MGVPTDLDTAKRSKWSFTRLASDHLLLFERVVAILGLSYRTMRT